MLSQTRFQISCALLLLWFQSSRSFVSNNGSLIGSYQFLNEFDFNMTSTHKVESFLGIKLSVGLFYNEWCPALSTSLSWYTTSSVRTYLNTLWARGKVPIFTWQPTCYDPSLPTLSKVGYFKPKDTFIRDIASGTYDTYIISVANELRLFLAGPDGVYGNNDDRRVYIRLAQQMNNNVYQWSAALNPYITPTDYVNFWKHTYTLVNQQLSSITVNGAATSVDISTRIQWIWNPNNFDGGSFTAEQYYPGNSYVNWLGMLVYNPGGGATNAQVLMLPMIARFRALSTAMPIAITEFGTQGSLSYKNNWYQDFFNTAQANNIRLLNQFNLGSNAVLGSTNVPQYASIVKSLNSWIEQSDSTNERIISDVNFMGALIFAPTSAPLSDLVTGRPSQLSNVTVPTSTSIHNGSLLGSFQFQSEFDFNMTSTIQVESWLNVHLSVGLFFSEWCPALSPLLNWYTTNIGTHLLSLWNNGQIPIFTWQPTCFDPGLPTLSALGAFKTQDTFIQDVSLGNYDSYIKSVATEVKLFLAGPDGVYGNGDDRRLYIRLAHEMNGNWYQWSAAFNSAISPTDYVTFWKRTRTIIDQQLNAATINGVSKPVDITVRLQWIWNPINFDAGTFTAEQYYPGNSYVDWLGTDVYNPNGGATNAKVLMLPIIARLKALTAGTIKPLAVTEFGTGGSPAYKNAWFQDFFLTAQTSKIGLLNQFNLNSNAVYVCSGQVTTSVSQYQSIVQTLGAWIQQSNTSNPKLVSDSAFRGVTIATYGQLGTVTSPNPSSTPSSTPSYPPVKSPLSSLPLTIPPAAPSTPRTNNPSIAPSSKSSIVPIACPSAIPSSFPTRIPSMNTASLPSLFPTSAPSIAPTLTPSTGPSNTPSWTPSICPSSTPSLVPTTAPSAAPVFTPSTTPSNAPSNMPSLNPTSTPSLVPTTAPSSTPSLSPTSTPSSVPTTAPSTARVFNPSTAPSNTPSSAPSRSPTSAPSLIPTTAPSTAPAFAPSTTPSNAPSNTPSLNPTSTPSLVPTTAPSTAPVFAPSTTPSNTPSSAPSLSPTSTPSSVPTTAPSTAPVFTPSTTPSNAPSNTPSLSPTSAPWLVPTTAPSTSPVFNPSTAPSNTPSSAPSLSPSSAPSLIPTTAPSTAPAFAPSTAPSNTPSSAPSLSPSSAPSLIPTTAPSTAPAFAPSTTPSNTPSNAPSLNPTSTPSLVPTAAPSNAPVFTPSTTPSNAPSNTPSLNPTSTPSLVPTTAPSTAPVFAPSTTPSNTPSSAPSLSPTSAPSLVPTTAPSTAPVYTPSTVPSTAPVFTTPTVPTTAPSSTPSLSPTSTPSLVPTTAPSTSPVFNPSTTPSNAPSSAPSLSPSSAPSLIPTTAPSTAPAFNPSTVPSYAPSSAPSLGPTTTQSLTPTAAPSTAPLLISSVTPSLSTSNSPTQLSPTKTPPSTKPSLSPTTVPSVAPINLISSPQSVMPSKSPASSQLNTQSSKPSSPTNSPIKSPSKFPSKAPSSYPFTITHPPSPHPSIVPSKKPSVTPIKPNSSPSFKPSSNPTIAPSLTMAITPITIPTASFSTIPNAGRALKVLGARSVKLQLQVPNTIRQLKAITVEENCKK